MSAQDSWSTDFIWSSAVSKETLVLYVIQGRSYVDVVLCISSQYLIFFFKKKINKRATSNFFYLFSTLSPVQDNSPLLQKRQPMDTQMNKTSVPVKMHPEFSLMLISNEYICKHNTYIMTLFFNINLFLHVSTETQHGSCNYLDLHLNDCWVNYCRKYTEVIFESTVIRALY